MIPIVELLFLPISLTLTELSTVPLVNAHAHNDYHHARPLWDALQHGFCSVEADIYLVDGKLLVAHDRSEIQSDRTLQSMYLEPLAQQVKRNGGRVFFRDGPEFSLLIDIKSDGPSTFRALHRTLAHYADILTTVTDGVERRGAVSVIISGNRPQELISAQEPRYASIDGRLSDLESELPAHLLPWISDRWGAHFRWNGDDEMSASEKRKLTLIVERAHAKGRRVRLWATPEKESVWQELRAAGVDLINTDDLAGLRDFLSRSAARKQVRPSVD